MKQRCLLVGLTMLFASLFSCQRPVSTIDPSLQAKADSTMKKALAPTRADSALVVVMSVQTGEILVKQKLVKNLLSGDYDDVTAKRFDAKIEPGPVFIPLAIMAAMEEKGLPIDHEVDTGNGINVLHGRTVYDKKALSKGGFGVITLAQCITYPSYIGTIKTVEDAFNSKPELFEKRMQQMSLGQPADSNVFACVPKFESRMNAFSIGYYFTIHPMQLLTAFNGIANNGLVVAPLEVVKDKVIINKAMCSGNTIKSIQTVLKANGKVLFGKTTDVAALEGISSTKDRFKREDVCCYAGYFPATKPKYTCLVYVYGSRSSEADSEQSADLVIKASKTVFEAMVNGLTKIVD